MLHYTCCTLLFMTAGRILLYNHTVSARVERINQPAPLTVPTQLNSSAAYENPPSTLLNIYRLLFWKPCDCLMASTLATDISCLQIRKSRIPSQHSKTCVDGRMKPYIHLLNQQRKIPIEVSVLRRRSRPRVEGSRSNLLAD
ncbi:uncharacterized protein M421DRAFT_225332 [Didymella exigua CBS 183.55]|uniref:Secreted protein n=1 Tax=Didymella exigua CBS 183.55 TaxID=1150837 RepID=A0A6A5RFR6_9PLEO|nr:uncharacterized protein M421DRAFT_225332 [Didymella exigua CBS 183.55]KAF1926130.1 hypothetical protein M421DRAFT_225332 [Didymella exigua CBS 183.55]